MYMHMYMYMLRMHGGRWTVHLLHLNLDPRQILDRSLEHRYSRVPRVRHVFIFMSGCKATRPTRYIQLRQVRAAGCVAAANSLGDSLGWIRGRADLTPYPFYPAPGTPVHVVVDGEGGEANRAAAEARHQSSAR